MSIDTPSRIIAAQAPDIAEWRSELAEALIPLRGQHPGLNKAQLLDLAAILCDWPSYARFRDHCPSPITPVRDSVSPSAVR